MCSRNLSLTTILPEKSRSLKVSLGVTKMEERATALDVSQGQNLRGRLTVADVCCLLVGDVFMVDWCRWQSREAAESLLLCFMLIEAQVVGVDFRAVEGSRRSEGCGRRVKRGPGVEGEESGLRRRVSLCRAVREADARFTRCACCSSLVMSE